MKIKLNNVKYRYDVYQIANLFMEYNEIQFVSENEDMCIEIEPDKIIIKPEAEESIIHNVDSGTSRSVKEEVKKVLFMYFSKNINKELPWGILVGIRPTKIALSLLNSGKNEDEIVNYYKKHYMADESKARLCIDIARLQRNIVNKDEKCISIYVDMPFCPSRCLYCSFTSNAVKSCRELVEPYLKALNYEMQRMYDYVSGKGLKIESVYFGGGTPTSIDNRQFDSLLKNINKYFYSKDLKEFTVECGRPDSITEEKLESIKSYGVSRISINPQTMNDDTLRLIGRKHTVQDVIDKYNLARKYGINDINMDIIVGLPGEGISHINNTCSGIMKLSPDSITVHGLSIKRGSRLHEEIINNHKMAIPDQHELDTMYGAASKLAYSMGMKPYYMYRQKNMMGNMENVGYAKENKLGLYNIQMIEECETIIALGADAVSKVIFMGENRIERFANVKDVKEYINRVEEMADRKINLLNTLWK